MRTSPAIRITRAHADGTASDVITGRAWITGQSMPMLDPESPWPGTEDPA